MLGRVTDAGFDYLTLSDAANPCDFAGGPKKPAGAAPDSIRRSLTSEPLFPTKVLIVEDEALVALDICDVLSEAGYEVVGLVATEQDALRKARDLRPDLIIMDLKLKGGGDGFRASRRINTGQNIPILYITAYKNTKTLHRLAPETRSDPPPRDSQILRNAIFEAVMLKEDAIHADLQDTYIKRN